MKRLWIIPVILLALMSLTTPIFADDPPDTDIDIGVSSPGDVDLSVDINAGGDTNVNINGNDLNGLATQNEVQRAIAQATSGGSINYDDWWRYYYKFLVPVFNQLKMFSDNNTVNLNIAMSAIVRLIGSDNLTQANVETIRQNIYWIRNQIDESNAIRTREDAEIWNQLMNGAEAHLGALQVTVDSQGVDIAALQIEKEQQAGEIDSLNRRIDALENELQVKADALRKTDVIATFFAVGVSIIAILALIFTLVKKR